MNGKRCSVYQSSIPQKMPLPGGAATQGSPTQFLALCVIIRGHCKTFMERMEFKNKFILVQKSFETHAKSSWKMSIMKFKGINFKLHLQHKKRVWESTFPQVFRRTLV